MYAHLYMYILILWNFGIVERREGVDGFLAYNRMEESMLNSCMVGSVPQHTLRHRSPQLLPTFDNSADDLDNLDDVSYIGIIYCLTF